MWIIHLDQVIVLLTMLTIYLELEGMDSYKMKSLKLRIKEKVSTRWPHSMELSRPKKYFRIWWMRDQFIMYRWTQAGFTTNRYLQTLRKKRHLKIHCVPVWTHILFILFRKTLSKFQIQNRIQIILKILGSLPRSKILTMNPVIRFYHARKFD